MSRQHRATAIVSILLLTAIPMSAEQLAPGIYSVTEELAGSDLEPLQDILAGTDIVGLGEAVHTTQGFSRAKVRVFQYLVEDMGYRAFGFETSWADAEVAASILTESGALT